MCKKVDLGLKYTNPDLIKCNEREKRYGTTIDAIINASMIEQTGSALRKLYSFSYFLQNQVFFCKSYCGEEKTVLN